VPLDRIFDRLGNLLRALLNDGMRGAPLNDKRRRDAHQDPYLKEAWDELNAYLNDEPSSKDRQEGRASGDHQDQKDRGHREKEDLKQDYANLEVPFGAAFEEVKKSYKRLLRIYHPDKNSNSPEKLQLATEITKKLNDSFNRIKKYEKAH